MLKLLKIIMLSLLKWYVMATWIVATLGVFIILELPRGEWYSGLVFAVIMVLMPKILFASHAIAYVYAKESLEIKLS